MSHQQRLLLALACLLAFEAAAAVSDDEMDDFLHAKRSKSVPARVVGHLGIGAVAATVGFLLLFPVEFVRRSSEYQRRARGSPFAPLAFAQALPRVLPNMFTRHGADFFLQSFLLFCPRLLIKFAVYGIVRGRGKFNPALGVAAALASGVVSLLYAFPFRKAELDNSINTGRFSDLAEHLRRKASRDGVASLYHGISAAMPYFLVHNTLLFLTMEFAALAVKDKPALDLLVAAPAAVVVASVFAAPMEQLRKTMVAYPFDYESFLYTARPRRRSRAGSLGSLGGGNGNGSSKRRLRVPDFNMLVDYAGFIWRRWTEKGVIKTFGRVHMRVNTAALTLSMFLHHALLR